MNHISQSLQHVARVGNQPFVLVKEDSGYRVYSPLTPKESYLVKGLPDRPTCSCRAFQERGADPEFLCEHLEAAFQAAQSNNGAGSDTQAAAGFQGGDRHMLLKRSVSPDGRIDSLSVEFALPLGDLTSRDIRQRASKVLELQTAIVSGFLGGHGDGNGNGPRKANGNPGENAPGVPAQMLGIESVQTRRGPCLCLSLDVGGRHLKIFGAFDRLGEVLTYAGYGHLASRVDHGMVLNLPCRVTLKKTEDGRYQRVDRVFPALQNGAGQ